MKTHWKKWDFTPIFLIVPFIIISALITLGNAGPAQAQTKSQGEAIKLLPPKMDSDVSIEKALSERRTVRTYKDEALTLAEVSQLLWAAQGITEPTRGLRTAPSPKAAYLIEVYLIAGNVANLPAGMYKYRPQGHDLVKVLDGDIKTELYKAVGQMPIKNAPIALVLTGAADRASNPRWMGLEAGHISQNIYLQAYSLKLGTVSMAGFQDEKVRSALRLPEKEQPMYIMPVGRK